MSECEKGSFGEVSVPKTSAAAIFSGDLYIFAKYAPVSPTGLFQLHLPPIATAIATASHRHGHLQRSMTYVRTCKWKCRGITSWKCASTWTLLPHPTPPQGTYKKMPKTLGRFSTRRHKLLLTTTYFCLLLLAATFYYLLLLTTTYYDLLLLTTTCYYVLLLTNTYYYLLLLATTCCYVLLIATTYYYLLLLTTTYYYLLLLAATCYYLLLLTTTH